MSNGVAPKYHTPSKCTQGDKVCSTRVFSTSASNRCMLSGCVPNECIPRLCSMHAYAQRNFYYLSQSKVWSTQFLGSTCIPSTQFYKIGSCSLCQSCTSCLILVNQMRSTSITPTFPFIPKFISNLLLVCPTNASFQGLQWAQFVQGRLTCLWCTLPSCKGTQN
jgi:hypothetical protein